MFWSENEKNGKEYSFIHERREKEENMILKTQQDTVVLKKL